MLFRETCNKRGINVNLQHSCRVGESTEMFHILCVCYISVDSPTRHECCICRSIQRFPHVSLNSNNHVYFEFFLRFRRFASTPPRTGQRSSQPRSGSKRRSARSRSASGFSETNLIRHEPDTSAHRAQRDAPRAGTNSHESCCKTPQKHTEDRVPR